METDGKLKEIAADEGSLANKSTLLKTKTESNFATHRKVAMLRKNTANIINDIKLQRIVIDDENMKSLLGDLGDSINALNANQDSPELKDILAQ